jgi:hypothetical protein
MLEMSKYDELLEEVITKILPLKETIRTTARDYIPKMYKALLQEDINLTPQEARERIEKDCLGFWSKRTIVYALPDEAKNITKQLAGKQRKKNCAAAMIAATTTNGKVLLEHEKDSHYSHNTDSTKQNQVNSISGRNENSQLINNKDEYIQEIEEALRKQQQFFRGDETFSEETIFQIPKEKFQLIIESFEKSNKKCFVKFYSNKILKEAWSDIL